MTLYRTKIVGIVAGGRQKEAAALKVGGIVHVVPEPDNAYDPNAVLVQFVTGVKIGYIAKEIASKLVLPKAGVEAEVTAVRTDFDTDETIGADIVFTASLK